MQPKLITVQAIIQLVPGNHGEFRIREGVGIAVLGLLIHHLLEVVFQLICGQRQRGIGLKF